LPTFLRISPVNFSRLEVYGRNDLEDLLTSSKNKVGAERTDPPPFGRQLSEKITEAALPTRELSTNVAEPSQ